MIRTISFATFTTIFSPKAPLEETHDGYLALCPAHGDNTPSLWLSVKTDGSIGICCRSQNCDHAAIMRALGYSLADLAAFRVEGAERVVEPSAGAPLIHGEARAALNVNVQAYQTALRQDTEDAAAALDYVRRWGILDLETAARYRLGVVRAGGALRVVIPFALGPDEPALAWQGRAIDPEATPRWWLPRNPAGQVQGKVAYFEGTGCWDDLLIVCEGPGDALTAAVVGGRPSVAVRGAGLASNVVVRDQVVMLAAGRPVAIAVDADTAGERAGRTLAEALTSCGLTVLIVRPPEAGWDLTDWYTHRGPAFADDLDEALREATPYAAASTPATSSAPDEVVDYRSIWDPDEYGSSDQAVARALVAYLQRRGHVIRVIPPESDGGRATVLVREPEQAVYVRDREQFLSQAIARLADEARKAVAIAERTADTPPSHLKTLEAVAAKLESATGTRNVLRKLHVLPGVTINPTAVNPRTPDLLICGTDVVDLRTGAVVTPPASWVSTVATATPYRPGATCPRFLDMLHSFWPDDPDLVDFVIQALGFALTNDNSEHAFFILAGEAGTGKSTLLEVIRRVLAPAARQGLGTPDSPHGTVDSSIFLAGKGDRWQQTMIRVADKRIVEASELPARKRFDTALLKRLASADTVIGRALYGSEEEVDSRLILWLATNHLPRFDDDAAIWRRVHVIPFTRRFIGGGGGAERGLAAKIATEEAEGILALLIDAARRWYESPELVPPETVRTAVARYRSDSLAVEAFFTSYYEVTGNPGDRLDAGSLFQEFKSWARERAWDVEDYRPADFAADAERIEGVARKRHARGMVYTGARPGPEHPEFGAVSPIDLPPEPPDPVDVEPPPEDVEPPEPPRMTLKRPVSLDDVLD